MNSDLSSFTTEELFGELQKRNANLDILKTRTMNINGITAKDIVIVYGEEKDYKQNIYYRYAPHIIRADGSLDFGYDIDEFGYELWAEFLPGFSESEECIFEYRGTLPEALASIEALGMTAKRDDEFFNF